MGGRGSSNSRGGGGSGGSGRAGKVTVTSATKALNANKSDFIDGTPPKTITINGVKLTGGKSGQYVSGGGYTVKTYQYTAEQPLTREGESTISFYATDYKMPNGKKEKNHERDKPKVFNVKISGSGYSTGRSGGI